MVLIDDLCMDEFEQNKMRIRFFLQKKMFLFNMRAKKSDMKKQK